MKPTFISARLWIFRGIQDRPSKPVGNSVGRPGHNKKKPWSDERRGFCRGSFETSVLKSNANGQNFDLQTDIAWQWAKMGRGLVRVASAALLLVCALIALSSQV